jgi:hypothetical protein
MALLPLLKRCPAGQAGDMSDNDRIPAGKMRAIRHAAAAVADVVRECNYANRRMTELWTFPDRRAGRGNRAPDTYADFLWRSPGALWREPPARRRAAGACPHRLAAAAR